MPSNRADPWANRHLRWVEYPRLDSLGGQILAVAASATLLTVAQSPFTAGYLAIVALVPWFLSVRTAGLVRSVLLGMLLGVSFVCISASWLRPAFESMGAPGVRSVIGMLMTAIWAKGLLFSLVGLCVYGARKHSEFLQILAPSAVVAIFEGWTSHSALGLPVLLIGHSQISVPGVAQLAVVTGVPGLSALLVALNCAIASAASRRKSSPTVALGLFGAWAATAVLGLRVAGIYHPDHPDGHVRGTADTVSLLAVQPNLHRSTRWDPAFQEVVIADAMRQAEAAVVSDASESGVPDLILLPENLVTSSMESRGELTEAFGDGVRRLGIPVVAGVVRDRVGDGEGQYRSSAVWWDPTEGVLNAIDKERAVPLVESGTAFPGRAMLLHLFGTRLNWASVEEARDVGPLGGDFSIATVLCFEVFFPATVSRRRDERTVAIVNLADDSWVHDQAADAQFVTAATFRAIEQRLPLIRVAHGGLSVWIDPLGASLAVAPPDEVAHFRADVHVGEPSSVEEKLAIASLPVSGMFAGMLLSLMIQRLDLGWRPAFPLSGGQATPRSQRFRRWHAATTARIAKHH